MSARKERSDSAQNAESAHLDELYNPQNIKNICELKNRKGIYDIKETDFLRVDKLRQKFMKNQAKEELGEEYFEEIGDVDPKRIKEIN